MNMIEFALVKRVNGGGRDLSTRLEAPVLPRVGDHVSDDKSGISGYVSDVMFDWDDKGKLRTIQVAVK